MKTFSFTSANNDCQSFQGLQAINVNVKKLVNPDRGLSTHKRPWKSKCVEVNRQGSFVLNDFKNITNAVIGMVYCSFNTLKRVLPDEGLVRCCLRLVTTGNTNKTEFPLTCILRDRSEAINDRQPRLKHINKSQALTMGGEGLRLVFISLSFSISFSPASRFNLNSSIASFTI